MLTPDSSVIISILLGMAIGLPIWLKWHFPREWKSFGICLVLAAILIISDLQKGAVLLGFGDYFRLGFKPMGLGLLLVLMIGFLRTGKIMPSTPKKDGAKTPA